MAAAASTRQPFSVAQWLNAVYCHPARPSALQRDVLTALAVKFTDWGTGTGCASIEMIAEFTRHTRSTIQRALRWGCGALLLVRTRRGHRLGNGKVIASEWRLQFATCESQGVNRLAVEARPQGVTGGLLNILKASPESFLPLNYRGPSVARPVEGARNRSLGECRLPQTPRCPRKNRAVTFAARLNLLDAKNTYGPRACAWTQGSGDGESPAAGGGPQGISDEERRHGPRPACGRACADLNPLRTGTCLRQNPPRPPFRTGRATSPPTTGSNHTDRP